MDHFAPGTDEDPRRADLASIVLADERARRRHERRGEGGGGAFLARSGLRDGYDARSVLVLALVVAALAAVVGWTTTVGIGDTTPTAHPSTTSAPQVAAPDASTAKATAPAVVPARRGVELKVGQVTTARSSSGGAVIRVSVANAGTVDGDAGIGTKLVVLLDGAVVGERALGGIAAGSSATTELGLDSCPSGRHSIAVIVDPRSAIRELDETDNARTSIASFGC